MGLGHQLRDHFEHVPGYAFFLKDAQSRFICASRMILARLGVSSEAEIIGTTDPDHFPPRIADDYVRDDRRVMQTGRPLIHHLEIWYNELHALDWCVTNKLPVRDADGRAIGVMGTIHTLEDKRQLILPYTQINRAVEHIRVHYRDKIGVEHLVRLSGLSPRQLRRRFREALGMSMRDFLAKTRIQAACAALIGTDLPIAAIAIDSGFCDQSSFTLQFREHTGLTPYKYRNIYFHQYFAD